MISMYSHGNNVIDLKNNADGHLNLPRVCVGIYGLTYSFYHPRGWSLGKRHYSQKAVSYYLTYHIGELKAQV